MRLIYLHQYFNTPDMVGGSRSYEMARRLATFGHEVQIVTSLRTDDDDRFKKENWIETREDGIKVHWTSVPYSNKMSFRNRYRSFAKFALLSSLKAASLKGDIVFATSTPLTIAIPGIYAKRRNKIPMVFEVRDLWPKGPISQGVLTNPFMIAGAEWLEDFAYRNSSHIIALSPGMKEGIVEAGFPENKVTIIPNCSDLDLFDVEPVQGENIRAKYNWLGNRPLVFYGGSFGLANGADYLVKLAAAVLPNDPEIRFVLLGDGAMKNSIHRIANDLGVLDKNLFILPPVPKSLMPSWQSASTISISMFRNIKSSWANSANKFFDAIAAGTPIAINYQGWQADLIRENGIGLVLDVEDIEKSGQLLLEVIHDKKWLKNVGDSAKKLAVERFSREKMAKKLESVLTKTVHS
jgi:glycosyltransferase involved in cell wall biosynthesis